jgi:hypothetical protein
MKPGRPIKFLSTAELEAGKYYRCRLTGYTMYIEAKHEQTYVRDEDTGHITPAFDVQTRFWNPVKGCFEHTLVKDHQLY